MFNNTLIHLPVYFNLASRRLKHISGWNYCLLTDFYMQIILICFYQLSLVKKEKRERKKKERDRRCSLLTGIRRVSSRAVEEVWWSPQRVHACVTVSVHTGGDGTVAALLGCWARHITVRRNTARVSTETWNTNTESHENQMRETTGQFSYKNDTLQFLYGIGTCWNKLEDLITSGQTDFYFDLKVSCIVIRFVMSWFLLMSEKFYGVLCMHMYGMNVWNTLHHSQYTMCQTFQMW